MPGDVVSSHRGRAIDTRAARWDEFQWWSIEFNGKYGQKGLGVGREKAGNAID